MRLNLLVFLLLLILACSCSKGKEKITAIAERPIPYAELQVTTNPIADTLIKAIPFFKKHGFYQRHSSLPPEIVPLKRQPQEEKNRVNNYPISSIRKVQKTGPLVSVTPGKNGIPAPEHRPARSKAVPVVNSEPEEALPPRMKDVATYDIQYLDVDQGLVSSYIRAILEDTSGNLWFGSSYGVTRYDGNAFIKYTLQSGLTDNTVVCILQDQRGDIWFGTRTGVTRYNGQEFFHYTKEEGFGDYLVRDILEDSSGDLWFGTTGGVIHFKRDSLEGQFFEYSEAQGLSGDHILAIEEDDRGYLWFGSDQGLTRYDGTSFTQYTTESGLISNDIYSIFKDSRGDLWFGTNRGVSRYDGNVFINYSNEEDLLGGGVVSIIEDSRGDIWFGTDRGVFHYETKLGEGRLTQFTMEDGLSNDRVRSILEDSEGNLWFGTGGGGVNRLKNTGFVHYTTSQGLTDNGIVFITEDQDGTLWYGSDKGLNRYSGKSFLHYTTREGLLHNDVHCGIKDNQGRMWFGTANGLSRFDEEAFIHYTRKQGLPSDNVTALMQDQKGQIWMGTDQGLCRFNPNDLGDKMLWLTTENGLLDNRIISLMEDQDGNVWITSGQGLCRYTPRGDGGTFTHYTTANGLLDNYVGSMLQDSEGRLWFGTVNGLNLFDEQAETDQFIDYTTADGLGNNVIWSILEDRKKNIWLSTEKGITLMQASERAAEDGKPFFNCYTFDKGDGLKRQDFQANSVCLDRQNRLWWGSEGTTMLDLSQFELTTEPPKNLHLTHIDVNQEFIDFRNLTDSTDNRTFSFRKSLNHSFDSVRAYFNYPVYMDLPHNLDHLTFHFSAINWARPHRIEYQYVLKDLENTWSLSANEPRVDYRNLSYGHYTFMVRAKGDAGTWSEPLQYHFRIRPAPWWSWWAWSIYSLLAISLVYGVFQLVKKRWLLKTELKKEQEKSIRVSRRESFRSRLYTNLTHEFRTPLNVILGMSEQIESDPDRFLDEGITLIQRNGEQLLRLINQLLDLAKLEDQSLHLHLKRGDIVSYLQYFTDSFKGFGRKKGLNLHFETDIRKVIMDYDPEQVGHIMTNLISNAVKFTPSGGFVTIRLDRRDEKLLIEVTDTGIGIAEENISQIFKRFYQVDTSTTRGSEGTGIGLAHTYELVKLMEGDIEVESELGRGTTFLVSLPIRTKNTQASVELEQESRLEIEQKAKILAPELSVEEVFEPGTPFPEEERDNALPRVLIVEDDHDSMAYLVGCLADKYVVDLANNGQMGIDKALKTIPDLIISDVMMPEKSGYDLCHILKNDEKTSHIPIILLTAKADMDSKIKGLKTGADAYLYKPFKKKELLVRLEAMMEKQRKLLTYFAKKFEKGLVSQVALEMDTDNNPAVEDKFIERIRRIVAENYGNDSFGMMDICDEINMSRSQLYRKMMALVRTSPSEFIRKYRLEKARILLETTEMNASEVAYATGYKDPGHFSKSFHDEFNIYPKDAGKKGR